VRHTRWRWKLLRAFPAAVVPNPHDRLQTAVFTAHLVEDELDRQRERYADAVIQFQTIVPQEAVKTLNEWRAALHGGPRESMYDAIRSDPLWRMSSPPSELRKVPAENA
jgi:hypothetical protein